MNKDEKYFYKCMFKVEILANREQEYIRRKKTNDIGFEDYASEFEELDFENAMRWIEDTTTTFYAKSTEEVEARIKFEFHNGRIDITPIIEEDYFYWYDNNCLVKRQRLLHRGRLTVDYGCGVDINKDDMIRIAAKCKEVF